MTKNMLSSNDRIMGPSNPHLSIFSLTFFLFNSFPSLSHPISYLTACLQSSSYVRSIFTPCKRKWTNRKFLLIASLWLHFPYQTEGHVTWRTPEASARSGRRARFKSKQMFCVSLHSEMKTCCDWQWREHTLNFHPLSTVFSAKDFGRQLHVYRLPTCRVLRQRHPPLTAREDFDNHYGFIVLLLLSWKNFCHKRLEASVRDVTQLVGHRSDKVKNTTNRWKKR